ncbi:MAG: hypothetical protein K6F32_00235 [Bacilli bacterium]|nr:hypothetical protein [Bacilli bacterium]
MADEKKKYDSEHRVSPLWLVMVFVNNEQGSYVVNLLKQNEAYFCCVMKGYGTAPNDLYEAFGMGDLKKEAVLSIIKADRWPTVKLALEGRFQISKAAKGVGFAIPLDSVAGVSIYKMLGNVRFEEPLIKKK